MEDHRGKSPGTGVDLPADLDLRAMEEEARVAVGEMAYAYYAGGAEEERLLDGNVAAWSQYQLAPRTLVDVSRVSTTTEVAGMALPSPIVVAPTAIHAMAHPEGEVATARGAARAGAAMVLSSLSTRRLEEVAEVAADPADPAGSACSADPAGSAGSACSADPAGSACWMQVYVLRDRSRTEELVHRAVSAGYRALVLTVDAPVSGLRRRELRQGVHLPSDLELPNLAGGTTDAAHGGGFMKIVTSEFDPALTYDDITWLRQLSGLPVMVKGVLRADDAARCVETGAAGVIVSNHGARQLDDAPPTAEVLPEVIRAVAAVDDGASVLVDGGLRRAPDVVKALCLGAAGVLIGRPVLWALATGGADGVTTLLSWLQAELRRTMALCGAPSVPALTPDLLRRPGVPGWWSEETGR